MRNLYLVRHASPQVRPDSPARDWALSERGISEAKLLAESVQAWGLKALYSSSEAKARSTALVIGEAIGLQVHVVDAFDELRIPEWIHNADEFNELVKSIFEGGPEPAFVLDPIVERRLPETAAAAAARFTEGVTLVEQGEMPAAIVAHGRVLTAYLSTHAAVDNAFEFWRSIPMPGWTSIDLDQPPAERRPVFQS